MSACVVALHGGALVAAALYQDYSMVHPSTAARALQTLHSSVSRASELRRTTTAGLGVIGCFMSEGSWVAPTS